MMSIARVAVFFGCVLVASTGGLGAEKPLGLPKNSPFMPPAGSAPVAATANETIEFAGVSSVGKRTDLIFYDKTAKKSHWIAKGETKEGIAVLNYDERREQAVVKINGVEKTLILRKAAGPHGSPQPVAPMPTGFNVAPPTQPLPAAPGVATATPLPDAQANAIPVAPPPPTAPKSDVPLTPEIRSRQETEARMLVSDLLEIGMAQRKAYEEAQRRAAQGGTQPAAEPPAGATPAPNP